MAMAKAPKRNLTFGQKFKNARKLGKANFMHNGKKYSTKTKEEVAKKATRKKARGIRKKARTIGRKYKNSSVKSRMAMRKTGRKIARRVKRTNKALRK
tara:strand:+ start:569 stop:862 length:294 start_codon:yes stop_codon:yes gene_type:complete